MFYSNWLQIFRKIWCEARVSFFFVNVQVLNHHIQRVNEAEKERIDAEESHRRVSQKMTECAARIAVMQKENGRSIKKSRHYFEQRVQFTKILENQKRLIVALETEVCFIF